MDTIHNQSNLSDDYIPSLKLGTPEDVQRYFKGYWSNSSTNSLFTPDVINSTRQPKPRVNTDDGKAGRDMTAKETLAYLKSVGIEIERVGVFADPAVTAERNSDETGICVAAVSEPDPTTDERHVYILADCSLQAIPDKVCETIVDAYHDWGASMIVMEKNQGGLWLESTLRKVWKQAPLSFVDATRTTGGKKSRAEPVSAQYSRGVVHHVGTFQKLEEQMSQFGNQGASKSPDRMDALVWAVTKLLNLHGERTAVPGITQARRSSRHR
jgi:phage terminase large subunit-like protein